MKVKFLSLIILLMLITLANLFVGGGNFFDPDWTIVSQIRLPRVFNAFLSGSTLAVSGVIIQALLGNPLADPFTLGVSSSAALFAVLGGFLGVFGGFYFSSLFAALGSLFCILLIYFVVGKKFKNSTTLLLIGVMIGFICSSLISLIISISEPNGVARIMSWLMGDLTKATIIELLIGYIINIGALIYILIMNKHLDAISLGDNLAESVGIDVEKTKKKMFVVASLLVGVSVSVSGIIGFVGLVIPHIVRKMFRFNHLRTIPASFLMGGVFVLFADFLATNIKRPEELAVGVFTSLIGAPFFLYLLYKETR